MYMIFYNLELFDNIGGKTIMLSGTAKTFECKMTKIAWHCVLHDAYKIAKKYGYELIGVNIVDVEKLY